MSESRTSFLRLFLGFFLSATGSCCPIELSLTSVVLRYGDPVSVNCSTSETEHGGMGWEAPIGGRPLEVVNRSLLTVENLTIWSFTPQCFINLLKNGEESQCTKDLNVVLYTFPETIRITPDEQMKEGTEHNLTCHIGKVAPVQNLTVRWYKGDTIFHTETFENTIKEPVDQSSDLSFTPTEQDNGVKFRCEAHLDLGPEGPQLNVSSQELTAVVFFGPVIQCSSGEVPEGETLRDQCTVKGYPEPHIEWLQDGKSVDPDQKMTREKAGLYLIKAEGSSLSEKEIQVSVIYGPELKCPSNYTALENAPHNLTCTVEGYPEPKTIWYRDGGEVELPENLTRIHAGQYLVSASNRYSSVNHTVELDIIYPPSPIVELVDSVVKVGSDVRLKCSSKGNPRPVYSWFYYRAANVMEENDDGMSFLIISNATADNIGSYRCQALNEIGNVSKTVKVTVKGVKPSCPIEITPDPVVVQYQDKAESVKCKPTSNISTNVQELYWKGVGEPTRPRSADWLPDTQNDWDLSPVCTGKFAGNKICEKPLNFILYKTPDSVSISHVTSKSSSVEEEECQLQCNITQVAPARRLIVRWYHGNETIKTVTGCQPENNINCNESRKPVNVLSTINVTLNRKYNEAEFRCEVELDLKPERLQIPYMKSNNQVNITVYYKPVINYTKLPKAIPVFSGYPEQLICEADGNPPPKIQWFKGPDMPLPDPGGVLNVSKPGVYICNATNKVGSASYKVDVILKEDYLPLIAGFVAVTVVIISVIFLFIYSIYYKNTKMRRYSLKNPKLSNHNGNVAHNGWDLQFPMTKLS